MRDQADADAPTERHLRGDYEGAQVLLAEANDQKVWDYTDHAWGKGAAKRYAFVTIPGSPAHFSVHERPVPRMPALATRQAALQRDGYHCRFCGIPVIDPAVRKLFRLAYPAAVRWGTTNATQHAAFQCMWLQFDHILPNSRGGDSSLENVVIACAACNFGRMQATLEEARVEHPLAHDPPVAWHLRAEWDGLECVRTAIVSPRAVPS